MDDEWHILSPRAGPASTGGGDTGCRAYQAWLNNETGEIRFHLG